MRHLPGIYWAPKSKYGFAPPLFHCPPLQPLETQGYYLDPHVVLNLL